MSNTRLIRSMPELIAAIRERVQELQLTHETVDSISGLQGGYVSKLLAPVPMKNLGPVSFEALLGAVGLAVVVVEDKEQVARVQGRWTKRERPLQKPSASMSASIQNQVPREIQITPELNRKLVDLEHMKRIAKMGAKRRNKVMGKRARQRAASHAARKRWAKRDEART